MHTCRIVLFFLCISVVAFSARAGSQTHGHGPITIRSQHPLYLQQLGLTPTRATSLFPGVFETRIDAAYSNLLERGRNGNHFLDLDMELLRLALHERLGIGNGFEVGIEVPFFRFDEGFLDDFLDGYHKTFGFPRGGRDVIPDNRFAYRFDGNGVTLFDLSSQNFGIGDVVVGVKHHFWGGGKSELALAWFSDFKIPTGDRGKGLGSGSPDISLGVALEQHRGRFHAYANAAHILAGGNSLLEPFVYRSMIAYLLAAEVTIIDSLSVVFQIAGSSPLFSGIGIDPYDGVPLDLVVGFRGEEQHLLWGQDFIWQTGFSEDVTSLGPSVDFTAFASLGMRFGFSTPR